MIINDELGMNTTGGSLAKLIHFTVSQDPRCTAKAHGSSDSRLSNVQPEASGIVGAKRPWNLVLMLLMLDLY